MEINLRGTFNNKVVEITDIQIGRLETVKTPIISKFKIKEDGVEKWVDAGKVFMLERIDKK
ncbi:MAG: hypothetical protein ACK5OW_00180 [bacterium]|jgi:hypothetical protein